MFGIDNEFGGKDYFDSHGNKIGYSMTGIAGQQEYYDKNGKNIGSSVQNILVGETFYDENGQKRGYSYPNLIGQDYYDLRGNNVGSSSPGLIGDNYRFERNSNQYINDQYLNNQSSVKNDRNSARDTFWEVIGIIVGILTVGFLLAWIL